jgi:hypothetical protein
MKNIEQKIFLREYRDITLEIMASATRIYKDTKDPNILEYIKWFGENSKLIKNQIANL